MGGKTALLPLILDRMPDDCDRYVEVFGGSGAVLFARPPVPFEIYNDYNGHLANMMWQIKNNHEYFLNLVLRPYDNTNEPDRIRLRLNRLLHSGRDEYLINNVAFLAGDDPEKLFRQIKRLVEQPESDREIRHTLSLLDKILTKVKQREMDPALWDAVLFYETIKLSYGNTCRSWRCGKVGVDNVEALIQQASRRLENVGIENKDFRDIIPQYDRPTALFYLDPPYYTSESTYDHVRRFTEQDHLSLHQLALEMEGRCLISYNGCDFIRRLYSEEIFRRYEFTRSNNLMQRYDAGSLFPELLISNYDMEQVAAGKTKQITLF